MVGDSQTTGGWGTPIAEWEDTSGTRYYGYSNVNGTTVIRIESSGYSNPFSDEEYNHRWEQDLQKIIAMGEQFREDFKIFFRGGWFPHKGYSGELPPIQLLTPPITTAAPAPDDRRRAIRAFMTVRPTRVP